MKKLPTTKAITRSSRRSLVSELVQKGGSAQRALEKQLDQDRARRESVDVAVLSDATGSMTNELAMVREKLCAFVGDLSERYTHLRLSAGFYRDHVPAIKEYDIALYDSGKSFVPGAQAEHLQAFIHQHGKPDGGSDREDMGEALYRVAHLPWMARTRVVLHIGDQNSHGYGPRADGLCRLNLTHDRLVKELTAAQVSVFMVQCAGELEVEKEYRALAQATGGRYLRFEELAACDEILVFLEAAIAAKSGGSVRALLAKRVAERRLAPSSQIPLLRAFNE